MTYCVGGQEHMNRANTAKHTDFISYGKKLVGKDPSFGHFFMHTLEATSDDDLADITPQIYETILRHSFARLGHRKKNTHLVNIWSPEANIPHRLQIVDVFVDDMPFLVDSVLGAIRASGAAIHLISHPILPVEKKNGQIRVLESMTESAQFESFLQIHFDPITDEVALAALFTELDGVLSEVRRAVAGWRPMLERMHALVQEYRHSPPEIPKPVFAEALHFLAWLADHNFTFLGMREYQLSSNGKDARLETVKDTGLGILDDPEFNFLRDGTERGEMTEQHLAFLDNPEPLMVTKANVRGRVHRRAYLDYIGA